MLEPERKERFSERQQAVLFAFADALLPPEDPDDFRATPENLIKPMMGYLEHIGRGVTRGFGVLLFLFDYIGIVYYPFFKRFTKLEPAKKEQYLLAWESSRIALMRQIFILLKYVVTMCMFSDKSVAVSLGYDPECLEEYSK